MIHHGENDCDDSVIWRLRVLSPSAKPEKFKGRFFTGNGFKFMVVGSNKNTVKFGGCGNSDRISEGKFAVSAFDTRGFMIRLARKR